MTGAIVLTPDQALFASAFAGMPRDEALAYISRLYDAAEAGAVAWDESELLRRFLAGCSRTGSEETRSGYARELRHLLVWRDQHHPGLALRQLDPAIAQDFIDDLQQQVQAGTMAPRSYNRRVAACSALFRWASEPCRSAVTGVPRSPFPRRLMLAAPKVSRALAKSQLSAVLEVISAAARNGSRTAARDYVMVRGSYLIGCRVSELARLRWQDIEPLDDGGQVHLLGKGKKVRTVRISSETLQLIEFLGRGHPNAWLFPSNHNDGPLSRQAIADRMARWGRQAGVHLHPMKLRHSHATHSIRAGIDVFVLQRSLGHSSVATTATYVADSPSDSSSLRLG
jgi:site-specific recombinase XerD